MKNASETFGWLSASRIAESVANGEITISSFNTKQLNPNSYNYRLGKRLLRMRNEVIDLHSEDEFEEVVIREEGTVIHPHECYLGTTVETFGSEKYASLITGRSSIGRKFITNHITAGLIDVGFSGQITLEITVAKPTIVYPNVLFGQIYWFTLSGQACQYNGKYNAQQGPTPSRMHLDPSIERKSVLCVTDGSK